MTNRELLQKAMPLSSLSNSQWGLLTNHISSLKETDLTLYSALNQLLQNQARLEIISNYREYYFDRLDEEVCSESFEIV